MQFHCFVFELRVDFICYNVAGIILQDERRYVKDWSDFIMEICAPIKHPDFCVASLLNRMYIKVA